jgi:hypothetical protein
MSIHIYIYIYIYTHTHTHIHICAKNVMFFNPLSASIYLTDAKISTTIVSFLHTWYIMQLMVDGSGVCVCVCVCIHTHTYIYTYTRTFGTHTYKHTPVPSTMSYIRCPKDMFAYCK